MAKMHEYVPTIGLEIHAELATQTKMFCGCRVVDTTQSEPNSSICPICTGMPGTLPVINRQAVEHSLRVALALQCNINAFSLFARKNYFYPDLPKGYQISQYEYPLATHGHVDISTSQGRETIQIRRVHLEEDTGKLTHLSSGEGKSSLVDLNRSGVALLEIVSEPELGSVESALAYATQIRSILRYLGACTGDMEKGAIRFEANLSIRKPEAAQLGTRVEIKNLNSFKAMEKALFYEIARQVTCLSAGESVSQETLGWDEVLQKTTSQRSKEEAHDYRYFPEPDLPPLLIDQAWTDSIRANMPELPGKKIDRFQREYAIGAYQAVQLCDDPVTADFFENTLRSNPNITPHQTANWILGELFAYLNQNGINLSEELISAKAFGTIVEAVSSGSISRANGKEVLNTVLATGKNPRDVIESSGFTERTGLDELDVLVKAVLQEYPSEVSSFLAGKTTLLDWFLGQVMRKTRGKADPTQIRDCIERNLEEYRLGNQ